MKKFTAILIFFIIILQLGTVAYAKGAAEISAPEITLTSDEQKIDVSIKDNPGIMGFMLTVSYPDEYVEVTSVSRGEVTRKGSFYDNLGTDRGIFDIVWNNTSEVKKDGVLFSITARAIDGIPFDMEIKISYKPTETFNENYDAVEFNCRNIALRRDEAMSAEDEPTEPDTVTDRQEDEELTNAPDNSAASVQEKTTVINTTADGAQVTQGNQLMPSAADIIQSTAAVSADNKTTSAKPSDKKADEAIVTAAVDKVLKDNGYSSIDEVEDEAEFIKQVNDTITELDKDASVKINDLSDIKKISDNGKNESTDNNADNSKDNSVTARVIIISFMLLVLAAGVAIIAVKRSKKAGEKI